MLQQFSKIFLALFIFAGVFFSCTEGDDPEPTPVVPTDTVVIVPPSDTTSTDTIVTPEPEVPTSITVRGSDYANVTKVGSEFRGKTFDNLLIRTIPSSGENQVWDLRTYQASNSGDVTSRENLPVPEGTSFTSASFVRTQQSEFISAFTYTEFYEVSDNGHYKIGDKVNAGTANLGNGTTLKASGTEVTLNPKKLIFKFPMNYNDVTEQEGIQREAYSLTAPAFGLTNAPVERKLTYPTKSEVVGWGKVILPQGAISDTTEVLLVKHTGTVIENYFLNGTKAPAALTNALNLKEGAKTTTIEYYFISKEFGTVARFSFETGSNGSPRIPATDGYYITNRN
jgi:hypothetical protein